MVFHKSFRLGTYELRNNPFCNKMDENEAVEWEMENFIAPKLQQQWMDFAYVEIIKKL